MDASVPPTSSVVPLVTSMAPSVTTSRPVSATALLTSTPPATTLPTSTPGVTSTPVATSTLVPTTSVNPTTSLSPTTSLTPTASSTPTSTPAVTSTAPLATSTSPATSTATPGSCANALSLTFSGSVGNPVGTQGPFSFTGWNYDGGSSSPPTYTQAILNQASSTQVINVTDANGILLCNIAASGTNAPSSATFQGITLEGQTVTLSQGLPRYNVYANVTFDSTWQPLSAIEIITTGSPSTYSLELWEIAYVLLGPI
ncbi:hypothetical protein COCOBI_18-0900 [Coccomyxa sp. Obi]|nr:hypothetical protein COCOBI_18-0900 [Coccomyxa sp. Obi]